MYSVSGELLVFLVTGCVVLFIIVIVFFASWESIKQEIPRLENKHKQELDNLKTQHLKEITSLKSEFQKELKEIQLQREKEYQYLKQDFQNKLYMAESEYEMKFNRIGTSKAETKRKTTKKSLANDTQQGSVPLFDWSIE